MNFRINWTTLNVNFYLLLATHFHVERNQRRIHNHFRTVEQEILKLDQITRRAFVFECPITGARLSGEDFDAIILHQQQFSQEYFEISFTQTDVVDVLHFARCHGLDCGRRLEDDFGCQVCIFTVHAVVIRSLEQSHSRRWFLQRKICLMSNNAIYNPHTESGIQMNSPSFKQRRHWIAVFTIVNLIHWVHSEKEIDYISERNLIMFWPFAERRTHSRRTEQQYSIAIVQYSNHKDVNVVTMFSIISFHHIKSMWIIWPKYLPKLIIIYYDQTEAQAQVTYVLKTVFICFNLRSENYYCLLFQTDASTDFFLGPK